MSNHLLNRNTELEMELKTIKAQNEIMMAEILNENQQTKEALNKAKEEVESLQAAAAKHEE